MTTKWIFPVLAAAAAGVISFGVTRHAARRAAGPELEHLQNIAFLTKTLHLNDAQAREIEVLHSDLSARLKDCCDRHCAARKRLGRSLTEDDLESDRMDVLLREMCAAYAESERLTLEHIRRVRNLLDPEQRRRFDELVLDALLCRNCPACGTETRHDTSGRRRAE